MPITALSFIIPNRNNGVTGLFEKKFTYWDRFNLIKNIVEPHV